MNWTSTTTASVLLVLAVGAPRSVQAQCPGFEAGFHVPGMSAPVRALEQFDDGTGAVLVAAGEFRAAGNVAADRIATWNGTAYAPLGPGLNGIVNALLAFDDGAGPALDAGGSFTASGQQPMDRIARWSGGTWSALGSGLAGEVMTLAVFDDGGGRALYAGGRFPGGIAKWDGSTWSIVGGGLSQGTPTEIFTLARFDPGMGGQPVLAAGGQFRDAGGVVVDNVAFWNGSVWSSPANGIPGTVRALIGFDDGSGSRLFATGPFGVRRWNGTAWSSTPIGQGSTAFHVFDDGLGGGPVLHTGGGVVSRWNGSVWATVLGIQGVLALHGFDGGAGPKLHAGGTFGPSSVLFAYYVAVLDGSTWRTWTSGGNGLYSGAYSEVLAVHDDGNGRKLYTAGPGYAGSIPCNSVARWDGQAWTALAPLTTNFGPNVLESWDDGSGSGRGLFASSIRPDGSYSLDRWAGGVWTNLARHSSYLETMAVLDDGTGERLFLGGALVSITPAGGAPIACNAVATWDGTNWAAFGSGINGAVRAFAVYDDGLGGGPAIFVGGQMTGALAGIARWNGSAWTPVGGGITGTGNLPAVWDLCVFDDGSGIALYACGRFDLAGGQPANGIARWNGSAWSAVGGPIASTTNPCGPATASSMAVFDDGTGSRASLYLVGGFETVAGIPARGIARWDGVSWSAVGSGLQGGTCFFPFAVIPHDDGDPAGPSMWLSGGFQTVDGMPSVNIARYRGCGSTGEIYCAGDGTSTSCPCGNTSLPGAGEGCANTTGLGGKLRARGIASTSNDSLVLVGTSMPPNASVLYFQGTTRTNGGAGVASGDGLRCAGGSVVRLDIASSSGGASSYPRLGDAPISVVGACTPGATRHYQVWYRDALTFCTSSTYNLTNGLTIGWQL